MSSYTEITHTIGDQWVAALKRAEDSVSTIAHSVGKVTSRLEVPTSPVDRLQRVTDELTESFPKAARAVASRLSQPREVVAANFALAERLLVAQRDMVLRLMDLRVAGYQRLVVVAPAKKTTRTRK